MEKYQEALARSPAPESAAAAFERIAAVWPGGPGDLVGRLDAFPEGLAGFARLLAVSPISARKIERDPSRLEWLLDPSVAQPLRGRSKLELQLRDLVGPDGDVPRGVHEFKCRELLRVAAREVAAGADIAETGPLLSSIAATCVRAVLADLAAAAEKRWGPPGTALAIFGMGKLGGMELNFSSDIDLIIFHAEDGEVRPGFTRRDYFSRIITDLVALFHKSDDAAGALFPIDLRLRPEGESGPLTRSLKSMENYYAAYGEVWERMALTKGRLIAGDEELAYDFERTLQSFVYPKHFSADIVEEVHAIKRRIERDLLDARGVRDNVKLGRGGIREIEFVVQTLQLLNGARHAFLQQRSTLRALEALEQVRLLEPGRAEALKAAYVFLRRVEHRLQIAGEQAIHSLPPDTDTLEILSRGLGFNDGGAFMETLDRHRARVRETFESFLSGGNGGNGSHPAPPTADFFADAEAGRRMLDALGSESNQRHVAPRTRRLYRRLEPLLLQELSQCADPDQALAFFVQFVERYGIRGLLYETLAANPRLLELLVRLFDNSRFLSASVLRRPQWIEEIARAGLDAPPPTPGAHRQAMRAALGDSEPTDALRIYKKTQELRIALRDLLGFSDLETVLAEFSVLADACVMEALAIAGAEDEVTLVALGKYGGRELAYGADLDIVLVGEESAAAKAAATLKALSGRTAEGIVFPTDCRLRPEGEASPIIVPLSRYVSYWNERAQFWELQALTKARPVAGPLGAEFEQAATAVWTAAGKAPDLFTKVREMHARIVEHRGKGDGRLSFKTGEGGLMAAEFLVQALQMRHGLRQTQTLAAARALGEHDLLPQADELVEAIRFFRRTELTLRRLDDAGVSKLPANETQMRQLAKRMGFPDPEAFLGENDACRGRVAALFDDILRQ